MAKRIITALHDLSRELGVHILTPENELLLALLSEGTLSSQELLEHSSRSRAGFFHVIHRLKRSNLIYCVTGAADKRRKDYSLTPEAVQMLVDGMRLLRKVQENLSSRSDSPGAPCTSELSELEALMVRTPQLTCEYQILLHLTLQPGATANQISHAIAASSTKFYECLESLVDRRLVDKLISRDDKRRKVFFISEAARAAIARTNERVLTWLEEYERKDAIGGPALANGVGPCSRHSDQ